MQSTITYNGRGTAGNKIKNLFLYIILILATDALSYLFQKTLITESIYYNSFQSQLDYDRINTLFNAQAKYAWLSYLFIPIWLSLKVLLVSLCIQTGALIQKVKLKFGTVFSIALMAEFVFLLPLIFKIGWFLFFKTNYTITDIQQFYPLSALNFFEVKDLAAVLVYPLQTFNLFELMYWIVLAGGIKQALNTSFDDGLKVVLSGYLPGLILWMLCLMFIIVSLTPAT